MRIIFKMFKGLGSGLYKAANFLLVSKVLNKKVGAKFLDSGETEDFLSRYNKGLLLDGENKRLSVTESFQNVLLVARVGRGKTTKYIIPNVLDKAKHNASMAINDPKGEVRKLTSGYLKAQGYNIITFDVDNVENSHYFNPCTEATKDVHLEQIAQTIIWCGNPTEKEAYWNNGATAILSVLLKCLSFGERKYFNLPNLHHLLQNIGHKGEDLNDWVAENCWNPEYSNDPYILNEWKAALTGGKEIATFIGICINALRSMTNRDLRKFFSKSDYDLTRFRREKTAIFFITPPDQAQYYSFCTSLFFRTLFNECMKNEHLDNKSLDVFIMYDEFGNSYVPSFTDVATTIRGYRVSLSLILQSISQLSMRYGNDAALSIQGAVNTNACLSGSDPSTANFFSDLSGKVRETQVRQFADANNDYREFNLLNSNEVRTMADNKILIVSGNRNPVMTTVSPFYNVRRFKKQATFPMFKIKRTKQTQVPLVDID